MQPDDRWPEVTAELVERLDKAVPELCPDPTWSDREIWIYVGRRAVVRMLHSIYDEQNSAL